MDAKQAQFSRRFKALTGHDHFPWQLELYSNWFTKGMVPDLCGVPTGLGKTSVIAIWILALARMLEAQEAVMLPRRLIYVVNRRTVVDQATEEAIRLRDRLIARTKLDPLERQILDELRQKLPLGADRDAPVAISTLRGQFADNAEWRNDPARPAVIVGTVDMIGSRLLFSGYGVGFKAKPLHAGFLGQDALLVHDEAHLEPAFQKLLVAIKDEQSRCGEFRQFRVMALTATSRGREEPFGLTEDEKHPPQNIPDPATEPLHVVWQRLKAKKGIRFRTPESEKERVADRIGELARKHSESHPGSAILVFVNSLEDHATVRKALEGEQIQVLTGTLRGFERDRMADPRTETGCPIFARFLKPPRPDAAENERWKIEPEPGTVYLVCTSAGEVGIDISADHMVCDLSTFDRMIQRFGRVNRFGAGDANIDIVHEAAPDKKWENVPKEQARWKTLEILRRLPMRDSIEGRRDASPHALRSLDLSDEERKAAFSPEPAILPTSDILFDAWALTTIRGRLPGRPPVEPYLHGLSPWEPPETYVAWREEVGLITGDLLDVYRPADLLEDYPLKPHELLRERSDRVLKQLAKLAERNPDTAVWLLDEDGQLEFPTLGRLSEKDMRDRINYCTVLLPPSVGGLDDKGLLNEDSEKARDVADEWFADNKGNIRRRIRVWRDDPDYETKTNGMRLIREIVVKDDDDDDAQGRAWHWYELPKSGDSEGSKSAQSPVKWNHHTNQVSENAARIVAGLHLRQELQDAVKLAAKYHDVGKKRERWQRSIGNPNPKDWHAKSGKGWKQIHDPYYRHEFGSLLDVQDEPEFQGLSDDMKDLVLHVIAAHHGRGRPHFPPDEAFDPEPNGKDVSAIAAEVPRRFARLQRKYGRWALAYLESLLRAADYAASAEPSAYCGEEDQ